jgi:hypothetical protein
MFLSGSSRNQSGVTNESTRYNIEAKGKNYLPKTKNYE